MIFAISRPYLWGRAAVEHHNIKKVIGHTLLKNATFEQVINVINPETMLKTAVNFPIHHNLKVQYEIQQISVSCNCLITSNLFNKI